MADPAGEADGGALRLDFDRRVMLRFHGSAITSDGGLLAYRELDDVLALNREVRPSSQGERSWPNSKRPRADGRPPRRVPTLPTQHPPAPSCAISLTGASRSRRAANESCKVAGMAKGGNGPARCQPCGPATSRPPSSTAFVSSSTKSGTPSVLATICANTSGGQRPAGDMLG